MCRDSSGAVRANSNLACTQGATGFESTSADVAHTADITLLSIKYNTYIVY